MADGPEPQATPDTPPESTPPTPPETDASKAIAQVNDRLDRVETVVNGFIEKLESKASDVPPVEPVAPAPEKRSESPLPADAPLKAEKKSGKYGSSLVFGRSE